MAGIGLEVECVVGHALISAYRRPVRAHGLALRTHHLGDVLIEETGQNI